MTVPTADDTPVIHLHVSVGTVIVVLYVIAFCVCVRVCSTLQAQNCSCCMYATLQVQQDSTVFYLYRPHAEQKSKFTQ